MSEHASEQISTGELVGSFRTDLEEMRRDITANSRRINARVSSDTEMRVGLSTLKQSLDDLTEQMQTIAAAVEDLQDCQTDVDQSVAELSQLVRVISAEIPAADMPPVFAEFFKALSAAFMTSDDPRTADEEWRMNGPARRAFALVQSSGLLVAYES